MPDNRIVVPMRSPTGFYPKVADGLLVFAGLALIASLFLPWFAAEYEPRIAASGSSVCFDGLQTGDTCIQFWSAWRAIGPHWAIPLIAFFASPGLVLRVLGDEKQPHRYDWLILAGGLLAVVTLSFVFRPDLAALNEVQRSQAELFQAEPWVYLSTSYAFGIFVGLGLAMSACAAAVVRMRHDAAEPHSRTGVSQTALSTLAAVGILFSVSYIGEVVTRF